MVFLIVDKPVQLKPVSQEQPCCSRRFARMRWMKDENHYLLDSSLFESEKSTISKANVFSQCVYYAIFHLGYNYGHILFVVRWQGGWKNIGLFLQEKKQVGGGRCKTLATFSFDSKVGFMPIERTLYLSLFHLPQFFVRRICNLCKAVPYYKRKIQN